MISTRQRPLADLGIDAAGVSARDVSHTFDNGFQALAPRTSTSSPAPSARCSGLMVGQDHDASHPGGTADAERGSSVDRRSRCHPGADSEPGHRLRLPALRFVPAHAVTQNLAYPLRIRGISQERPRGPRRDCPGSDRLDGSKGSQTRPAEWRSTATCGGREGPGDGPKVLLLDEPLGAWTGACASSSVANSAECSRRRARRPSTSRTIKRRRSCCPITSS